jgi:deazaflavin-dependent oxidoreductase (nitroreductase family)
MTPTMRRIFWFVNKYFMAPLFRLGFGSIFGNPFSGYIMVMKVIGRVSGKLYYVPVNYAIRKGAVYCISGGRRTSDWFKNLMTNPEVELILPGGAIFARTDEITDPDEKRILARQVLINAGFAGYFEGYNPRTISDDELQNKIAALPVLRFEPMGIGSGASDSGGWAWISAFVISIAIIVGLVILL